MRLDMKIFTLDQYSVWRIFQCDFHLQVESVFETVEEEKEEESTLTSMFSQQFTNLVALIWAAFTLLCHLTLVTLCDIA